jgi:hypothetical protein
MDAPAIASRALLHLDDSISLGANIALGVVVRLAVLLTAQTFAPACCECVSSVCGAGSINYRARTKPVTTGHFQKSGEAILTLQNKAFPAFPGSRENRPFVFQDRCIRPLCHPTCANLAKTPGISPFAMHIDALRLVRYKLVTWDACLFIPSRHVPWQPVPSPGHISGWGFRVEETICGL